MDVKKKRNISCPCREPVTISAELLLLLDERGKGMELIGTRRRFPVTLLENSLAKPMKTQFRTTSRAAKFPIGFISSRSLAE
jgi:hypothetical protein